ncbi:MAG: hypothetical protein O3C60_17425, partial [Planctomycetota bacterium]|nr:hypothetical protein [Planctomycetota bacterium]
SRSEPRHCRRSLRDRLCMCLSAHDVLGTLSEEKRRGGRASKKMRSHDIVADRSAIASVCICRLTLY